MVESWHFDFADRTGSLGGFARIWLEPARANPSRPRRAGWWAGLVGAGRPYLLVRDDDAPWPDGPPLELRSHGLWAAATCETPLAEWGVAMEAFAVGLDDPLEAWGREWGDRTGLGFDLSWFDEGGQPCRWDEGYLRWGTVEGEVLVGGGNEVETIAVDAVGVRRHIWGPPRATSWTWAWNPDGGRTEEEEDGRAEGEEGDRAERSGLPDSPTRARPGQFTVEEHAESLPRSVDGLVRTDGHLVATYHAPVLDPPDWVSRALAQAPNGSVGWLESRYPSPESQILP